MSTNNASACTGYYRYTDIAFHYPKAIADLQEASALKLAVHHKALGDPSHPLRAGNERGLELFIGTLPKGESRLMFSSAQVEYLRYLVHAMGFAKKPLPLPSSEYLLTEAKLTNVTTVYLKTPYEIKKAYDKVRKNSRKVRNDAILATYRYSFEKVRNLYACKKGSWLAIDIEAWTLLRSAITEFGWSYFRTNGDEEVQEQGHYIVKKNKNLRNGQYVADARKKYAFGTSLELETEDFKKAVRELFGKLQESGPLFLIFHDCRQDIEFLKNTEYFGDGLTSKLEYSILKEIPDEGTFVIDTTELFSALEGDIREKRSLADMCRLLQIQTQHLHNAGNDAYYTLLALKSMASGNQVDAQREERWPSRILGPSDSGSDLKVFYSPEDEDSDFSPSEDEE
ncbi:hypothetical protein ACEPAI_6221 [Sanghuangporus weigelae]